MPLNLSYVGLFLLLIGSFSDIETRVITRSTPNRVAYNYVQREEQSFPTQAGYSSEYPETTEYFSRELPAYQTSRAITLDDMLPNSPNMALQRVSYPNETPVELGMPVQFASYEPPPQIEKAAKAAFKPTGGISRAQNNNVPNAPINLLSGKDLKPDFGFVNNKKVDGQLRKVTYSVDDQGNIVENSAQVVNS